MAEPGARSSGGGIFKEKLGPVPVWGWVLGVTAILLVYFVLVKKKQAASTTTTTATTAGAPPFIIQNIAPPVVVGPTTTSSGGGGTGAGGGSGRPPRARTTTRTTPAPTVTRGGTRVTAPPTTVRPGANTRKPVLATAPGSAANGQGGVISYNRTGSVSVTKGSVPLTTGTTGKVRITPLNTSLGQLTPRFKGTVGKPTAAALKTPATVKLINTLKSHLA